MTREYFNAESLTRAEFKKHPVTTLLKDAAHFGRRAVPSAAELDALKLDAGGRKRVLDACEAAAEIHAGGHHERGWEAAEKSAAEIIDSLPEAQQNPAYADAAKPDPFDTEDPLALADRC